MHWNVVFFEAYLTRGGDPVTFRKRLAKNIGIRISEARRAKVPPMTQSALATAVGSLTEGAVSSVETGRHSLTMENLCRVALALDLDPAALLPTRDEILSLGPDARADEALQAFVAGRSKLHG